MAYNIGPKIGIDGEKQFRQQIKAINNEYKTLQAQTKALTAEFDKNGDQQGKLKMQTQQLEKEIDNQKYAIFKMKGALEEAERTTGANSDAVMVWQGKIYDAQATVAKLEKELQDTEQALQDMEDGVHDAGNAADDAGGAFSDFGKILGANLTADAIWDGLKEGAELLVELGKEAVDAASEIRAEGAQFTQTFGEMEKAATGALEKLESKTGISASRIKGNFSTVYAFAKTMGADSAGALDIASRAMAAAADSAAYYDKTVEEVTETIQAYIKGNYANDAALGIASTETTRNAAALERYGKAFKELTEAQKVDTLLAMVEAGNKASGAMGQAAREAGEWTNVTGELTDAQKQLMAVMGEPVLENAIPVVRELTSAMRELAEVTPSEELRRSMEDLQSTMLETERTYKSTEARTLATATMANRYLDQLAALERQGLNTAQAHAEYEAVVTKLKAVMPELNITIDEQTGLIEQNIDALKADVEAWKQAAIAQAMYSKLTSQMEAYGEAQRALVEAQQKRAELEGHQETDLQTLANLLGVVGAAYMKTSVMVNEALPGLGDTTMYEVFDKAGNRLAAFSDTMLAADTEAVTLAKSIDKAKGEISRLDGQIATGEETVAGYEAQIDAAAEAIGKYTDTTENSADAQEEQQKAVAQTQAALLELENAYQEAENATRAMLDSSVGLWDEMAQESEWSAEKVLENWRAQMRAFSQYGENLKKAQSMGLADGIIEALSDGSEQSMQILDAMVNQSEISVGEINAAFTDLGLSKDDAADALMGLDTSLQEGYAALVEEAKNAGVEIVDGIAQAIEENAYKVGEALSGSFATDYQTEAEMLAGAMAGFTAPAVLAAAAGTPRQISNQYHIEITQLPGEDSEALAQRIMEQIANETEWKGAGLGG